MRTPTETVRIAAIADVHCTKRSHGHLEPCFARATAGADVLLLGGDLTDYGLPEEAHVLALELRPVLKTIPVVAVLGNHDFESGRSAEVTQILADAGVVVLDGDACELYGVGFAGVKGFAGGFGRAMLTPWGEPSIKAFVHEAVEESLKLERALASLQTSQRVALMHYAPIEGTVVGEKCEIFPFMGTSRLEECLNRHPVTVVFHGHAHRGALEGRTSGGIPVYNVAKPLLERALSTHAPFRLVEIPIEA
jgi:Icc-related predicted phosphoesterase